jgi:hypothetical protein
MPGAVKPSRKSLVLDYLRLHQPHEITPEALAGLRRHVLAQLPGATLSNRYLLEVAEQAGVPASRELGGIPLDLAARLHLHDLATAETFLRDVHREYAAASSAARAADCRRTVLRARRRLEALLRRPSLSAKKRAEKEEILSWVRVWLETPDLFPGWLDLRKRILR